MVVEVVLDTIDFLIGLVSLSGHEYHVSLLSHHAGGADSLASVNNAEYFFLLRIVETRYHVVDDGLWLFVAWIVAGQYHFVAPLDCFHSHQRPLTLVAVSSCSANGDYFSTFAIEYVVDGYQHVLQCVRRMGIVNNRCIAFGRIDGF